MMFAWLRDKAKRMLLVSLALMLLSMAVTNWVQTDGGRVTVKTLTLESISGHTMSAKLYIPPNATSDAPAPAVVYAHGWYNSKENGDAFAVEYARRGYVVLAYDMYSHGNSEDLDNVRAYDGGNGMYDAAFYVSTLPYVDSDAVIISGHSAGANACSKAVALDNERGAGLIRACILISYDPVVMDTANGNTDIFGVKTTSGGAYNNIYGSRDVALIAGRYDDYFFTVKEGAQPVSATREYLSTPMAKSFVTFGQGPDAFDGAAVEAGKFYTETVDGKEAVRVIYQPSAIHASTWLSADAVADGAAFLESRFPSGASALSPRSQSWPVKSAFTALGLIGFWMFLAFFAIALLDTSAFGELRAQAVMRTGGGRTDLVWSLSTSAVKILCSVFIIWGIMNSTMYSRIDPIWRQKNTLCIAGWAAVNGVVIALTLLAWWFGYAREGGVDLREAGLILPRRAVLKTIGIAAATIVSAWGIVFLSDYFFQTDFRFWQWSVKAFTAQKIAPALPFLPLFLLFYIANSIAINVQGYSDALGKNEGVSLFLQALLNSLSPLTIIVLQYTVFFTSGYQLWGAGALARIPTWLHTSVLILFVTPYITRAIYKRTRNPYIGGIINGVLVTLCMCMNSATLMGTGL